jgi:chorismate mutase
MTEQQNVLAAEREEIATRVASFKATQEKFQREREEYFAATLQKPAADSNACHSGPADSTAL